MTPAQLLSTRLHNQQLVESSRRKPVQVVSWLGAMQAQDYPAAKWAIGLRAPGCQDGDVEQAFNDGAILRTHVLRPTWHFVAPADIRWMLALTAPRLHSPNAYVLPAGRARREDSLEELRDDPSRPRRRQDADPRGARRAPETRAGSRRMD